MANYNNLKQKSNLSYIGALRKYNNDLRKSGIEKAQKKNKDYLKRRNNFYGTFRKVGSSIAIGAATVALASQLYTSLPSCSKKADVVPTTTQEETIAVTQPEEKEEIEKIVENEYGPIYFTIAGKHEIETNKKYDSKTPSEIENIALEHNKKLELNQANYSVFEITVKGENQYVFNPILTECPDDGNLYMTWEQGPVYKLFPDRGRSDDDRDIIRRLKDDDGNFLELSLDEILNQYCPKQGEFVVNITETRKLGTEDRKLQSTVIIYKLHSGSYTLLPECLNPNEQFWDHVNQQKYGCGKTESSYLIHGVPVKVPVKVPVVEPPEKIIERIIKETIIKEPIIKEKETETIIIKEKEKEKEPCPPPPPPCPPDNFENNDDVKEECTQPGDPQDSKEDPNTDCEGQPTENPEARY